MKKIILFMVFVVTSMTHAHATSVSVAVTEDPILRHVVSFKFKAATSQEKLNEIIADFKALPQQIPTIKAFEWGTNNSPEGLNKELTHCFLLSFESEASRDAYLPHPAHKAFGAIAAPYIEDVFVIDYWVN